MSARTADGTPAIEGRRGVALWVRIGEPAAHVCARQLVQDILRTASVAPHMFETTEAAAHLQERLLLAFDDLFRRNPLSERSAPNAGGRSARLVQRIDDYVAAYPTAPIYTADLAGEFGVSIRTLGGAVAKVRGMSLHQYIRLKRPWATVRPEGSGLTNGALGEIRTPDPRNRNPMLYPAELRAR
jgi:AraC-like DNA-binding protein